MEQIKTLIIEILGKRSIGDVKLIATVQSQLGGVTEAQVVEVVNNLIESGDVLRAGGDKRKFLNLNAKRRTPLAVAVEKFVISRTSVSREVMNVFVAEFMTDHGLFNPLKKPQRQVWGASLGLLRDKTFVKNTVDGVEMISVASGVETVVAPRGDYAEPVIAANPVNAAIMKSTPALATIETDPGFVAA